MKPQAKQDGRPGWWLELLSPETLRAYLEYTGQGDDSRDDLRAARQRRWRKVQKARLRDS